MDKSYIYQTGTINSLLEAVYDGDLSIAELKKHGNFGIGAFNSIDGEMIVHEGICYRANAYGEINIVQNNIKTPFAMVNNFVPEKTFNLTAGNYLEIEKQIKQEFISDNLIYAIMIKGKFKHLDLRSEHCTCRPYKRLIDILPNLQTIFEFHNISGVLIGLWFPKYMGQLNVPGFHFHFIDNDKKVGGHVFGMELESAECELQVLHGFKMELLATPDFYNANLDVTKSSDVAQVEQMR